MAAPGMTYTDGGAHGATAPARSANYLGVANATAAGAAAAFVLFLWLAWGPVQRLGGVDDLAAVIGVAMAFTVALSALLIRLIVLPRIMGPASRFAATAEVMATGDLTRRVEDTDGRGELKRAGRALNAAADRMRDMVAGIDRAAGETDALAAQITAGTQHTAAAAEQMAATAAELSRQATEMAETIRSVAGEVATLAEIAARLHGGARQARERNADLRGARGARERELGDTAAAVETLTADARANADRVEQLVEATEAVDAFVTLVQKLARQSKLLALNAAMEAARAGERGQGFAVVAGEVRRLAASSADAASRAGALVKDIRSRVDEVRASSGRAVDAAQVVAVATREGFEGSRGLGVALDAAQTWAEEVDDAAGRISGLATGLRGRVERLEEGTDAFAAAMQETAASSQEQSAGAEQMAAAAAELAASAERVKETVRGFRLA
jgi:methyl-accepting chemotaxis protein